MFRATSLSHSLLGAGAGLDASCAAADCAPFLLDPVALLLAAGWVPGSVRDVCVCLVAGFVVGVSAHACGGAAMTVAGEAMRILRLPTTCAAGFPLAPCRSPGRMIRMRFRLGVRWLMGSACV